MPHAAPPPDLSPPPFGEGLDDWSRGLGTPEGPTYEDGALARIARGDPDFGDCLELRKTEAVQRLRYMGEVPVARGGFLAVRARLKLLRGPAPAVRIGAFAGGLGGRAVPGQPTGGPLLPLPPHGQPLDLAVVIGQRAAPGVDLVWDAAVLYAHVGIDLVGPSGGVLRIDDLHAADASGAFGAPPDLPGFETVPGL
jgi:hypothetical protein